MKPDAETKPEMKVKHVKGGNHSGKPLPSITKTELNKMSYQERLHLYHSDPARYRAIRDGE